MDNFYEHIDIIFDNLYEKFGITDELVKYKSQLLSSYENEKGCPYKNKSQKYFQIDKDGYIRSIR